MNKYDYVLNLFVSRNRNQHRRFLKEVNQEGGYVVATDSFIGIMLREYLPEGKYKRVESYPFESFKKTLSTDGVVGEPITSDSIFALLAKSRFEYERHTCNGCDGEGSEGCPSCDARIPCTECEGSGELGEIPFGRLVSDYDIISLFGIKFNPNLLNTIAIAMSIIGGDGWTAYAVKNHSPWIIFKNSDGTISIVIMGIR